MMLRATVVDVDPRDPTRVWVTIPQKYGTKPVRVFTRVQVTKGDHVYVTNTSVTRVPQWVVFDRQTEIGLWGDPYPHTHPLGQVVGLVDALGVKADKTALGAKADKVHGHTISSIDGLTNELDKRPAVFTPEAYGAIGDGKTNDSAAFTAVFKAANGAPIHLRGGATYHIGTPLSITGTNVDLRAPIDNPATLHQSTNATALLSISGRENVLSRPLDGSIGTHSTQWSVTDTTGIKPGMLMTVTSSKLWYHDHRDTARKSELHYVQAVKAGKVITRDPAFDTYVTSAETTTLTFHEPIGVSVTGVRFVSDLPAPSETRLNGVGLRVAYAYQPLIDHVSTHECAAVGISIIACYAPLVKSPTTIGSCDYWTGYGIQTSGTTYARILDSYASGCRRGVDVSGGVTPSRRTRIVGGTAVAAGKNARGASYGFDPDTKWAGVAQAYGFGSHGPADDTTYEGCTTVGMHHHYTLRGRNEKVVNGTMVGRGYRGAIVASYGSQLMVSGCNYTTGFEGANGQSSENPESTSTDTTYYGDGFVLFGATYEGNGGSVVIKNNSAVVKRRFVAFEDASVAGRRVTVQGNDIIYREPTGETPAFVVCETGTADSTGWVVAGNVQRRYWGTLATFPASSGVTPALSSI